MLFTGEDIFGDRRHEGLILGHLLERVPDVFQEEQLRVLFVDLEECAEVGVLSRLRPDTFLLEHAEEVFRLEENHREVLRLRLNILLKDYLFKEVLCGHSSLQEVHHEHHHDFDRFLVQLRQIQLFLFLFLLGLAGSASGGSLLRLVLGR